MNLSIGARIMSGFALVVAMTVILAVYALSVVDEFGRTVVRIADTDVDLMYQDQLLRQDQKDMRVLYELAMSRAALSGGRVTADVAAFLDQWAQKSQETMATLERFEASVVAGQAQSTTPEIRQQWAALVEHVHASSAALAGIRETNAAQFERLRSGRFAEAVERVRDIDELRLQFDRAGEGIAAQLSEISDTRKNNVAAAQRSARTSILAVLGLILLLSAGAAVLIQRSVSRPLGQFASLAERVGAGDLSLRAPEHGGRELAQMGRSLNAMVDGLRAISQRMREVTNDLVSSSSEILASTQQQATSSNEQAASVQETVSTMQEIGQSGRQIQERAQSVAGAAETTLQAGDSGLRSARATAETMDAIRTQAESVATQIVGLSERAQQASEIVRSVNDLSEQSNLLAINAAIEAAAAGEHGRSFAVVATEMKALAEQAKAATAQVRAILEEIQRGTHTSVMLTEESVKRIETGHGQMRGTETAIRELQENVAASVQAFQQIVGATGQQQIGIDQVGQALQDIRVATQQTAAGTSQLESTAAALTDLSRRLSDVVGHYRL